MINLFFFCSSLNPIYTALMQNNTMGRIKLQSTPQGPNIRRSFHIKMDIFTVKRNTDGRERKINDWRERKITDVIESKNTDGRERKRTEGEKGKKLKKRKEIN